MTAFLSFLLAIVVCASCARPGGAPPDAGAPPASAAVPRPDVTTGGAAGAAQGRAGPLAELAARPLIVLPVQTLRVDVPEWTSHVGETRVYLGGVDDELAFAVRERAFPGKWALAADLARSARRNPGHATDPYALALTPVAAAERNPDLIIAEPLASQLRALAGLHDARYALVPTELRLAPDSAGAGRALLHLALIDVRQARVAWKGDIASDPVRTFSPALAASVAGRVADLFTPAR